MKFYPDRNKSLVGLVYIADRETVERVSYIVNNVFIPFSAFLVIIICTIILVIKLRQQANWRQKSTTAEQADKVTIRNQKVAKMVVMISTLFIVCFVPVSLVFIAMSLEPELSVAGKYRKILIIVAVLGVLLESVNSSVNIFVYYRMSSKYRTTIRELFILKTLHAELSMSF